MRPLSRYRRAIKKASESAQRGGGAARRAHRKRRFFSAESAAGMVPLSEFPPRDLSCGGGRSQVKRLIAAVTDAAECEDREGAQGRGRTDPKGC